MPDLSVEVGTIAQERVPEARAGGAVLAHRGRRIRDRRDTQRMIEDSHVRLSD